MAALSPKAFPLSPQAMRSPPGVSASSIVSPVAASRPSLASPTGGALSSPKRDDPYRGSPPSPALSSPKRDDPYTHSHSPSLPSRLNVLVDAPIFPGNVNLSIFSPTGDQSPTRNKFLLDKHMTPPRSPSGRTASPSTRRMGLCTSCQVYAQSCFTCLLHCPQAYGVANLKAKKNRCGFVESMVFKLSP